jgi:Ca-activated chloride channel family protein
VQLTGADGIRADWHEGGSLRIPLGALHAGQHREALVKVRIVDPAAFEGHTRPLASVRLRFRDSTDGDLERIQEVVARTQLTGDEAGIARTMSSRTKAIMAINESSRLQLAASQRITSGDFGDADRELEKAQRALQAQASVVKSAPEKKRLEEAAGKIASSRAATKPMAAAPKAAQRDHALKMNADAMHSAGF